MSEKNVIEDIVEDARSLDFNKNKKDKQNK